jgi:SnoaL-like protein
MPINNPREIVERYQKALGSKDFEGARGVLSDDLEFHGPIDTFHRADDYMTAIQRLSSIIQRIEPRKTFVDGQDVCFIYNMVTNTPAGTAPVAEWYRVAGDRIEAIDVFFDARPFAPATASR